MLSHLTLAITLIQRELPVPFADFAELEDQEL